MFQTLLKVQDVYRIEPKKIRFDKPMLKLIINMGCLQGCELNHRLCQRRRASQHQRRSDGDGGVRRFSKIEGFGFLPITSFTMALTTFVGQNLGARELERTRKGARFGILCSMVIAEGIGILIFIGAPWLIAAFNRDPQVIAYGTDRARTSALFFFLLAFSHCMAAILRGAGKSTVPMLVMLTWCAARVTFITLMVKWINSIQVVFWAYPLTWLMSSVIFSIITDMSTGCMPSTRDPAAHRTLLSELGSRKKEKQVNQREAWLKRRMIHPFKTGFARLHSKFCEPAFLVHPTWVITRR